MTMNRLRIFTCLLMALFLVSCGKPLLKKTQNRQIQQIGHRGSDPGQFLEPRSIVMTHRGNLLVTDFRNYRIQELNPSGEMIESWGSKGQGPGQFNDPTSAVMDRFGNLYVVDTWNHRIQKRTRDGTWIPDWTKGGGFYAPRGIAVDSKGRVYVANTSYHQVKVYDTSGNLLHTWGDAIKSELNFNDPLGLAFGPDGNLYVADTGNHRIKIMSPEGKTLDTIHVADWSDDQFTEAYIAVDRDNRIYVTAPNDNLILVYTRDGQLYSRFGELGPGPEQFNSPIGITVDDTGHIYVTDSMNNRIVKYAPAPALPISKHRSGPISRVLSILRILLDLAAVMIVIRWWFTRNRDPKIGSSWNQVLQNLEKRPSLMLGFFVCGFALILTALFLYSIDSPGSGTLVLLMGLISLFVYDLPGRSDSGLTTGGASVTRKFFWISLSILIVITLFFRVYRIDTIPSGINNDAAWNGTYALRILDGEKYTPFTCEAWGKSTLYFNFIALVFKLFGASKLTLYIPCISAGILGVILFFFLFRYLFNTRFALAAGLIFSLMAWNLTFSRTGYRAILAPICLFLTAFFYYRAIDARQWWSRMLLFAGSGFSIGLGLHTYFAFRAIPLMMIAVGIHSWITEKRFMRRNWWGLTVLLLVSIIVIMPLLQYGWSFTNKSDGFLDRVSQFKNSPLMGRQNTLFVGEKIEASGSLNPIWHNISKNLLIFHYKARVGNFFNNELPLLARPTGLLMLLGLVLLLRKSRERGPFLVHMIFIFGMLPAILSEADAARSLLTASAIAVYAAAGAFSIIRFLPYTLTNRWRPIFLGLLITWCCASEYYFYFHRSANDIFAQFGYAYKHTELGFKALDLSKDNEVYVSQGHFIDTPIFICYAIPGDVFSITNREVIDVVADSEIINNVDHVLNSERMPGKGLAFVLENGPKNILVLNRIKQRYPHGKHTPFLAERDLLWEDEKDIPMFYTYVIPPDQL